MDLIYASSKVKGLKDLKIEEIGIAHPKDGEEVSDGDTADNGVGVKATCRRIHSETESDFEGKGAKHLGKNTQSCGQSRTVSKAGSSSPKAMHNVQRSRENAIRGTRDCKKWQIRLLFSDSLNASRDAKQKARIAG